MLIINDYSLCIRDNFVVQSSAICEIREKIQIETN